MQGMKTIIITGATSGIGLAIATTLAMDGYRVIGIGHSEQSCRKAEQLVHASDPTGECLFKAADLMQQREVHRIADELEPYIVQTCGGKVHALINNVGGVRSWYATTEEGYEQQFALNHLAGFLLTSRLLPYVLAARGRVVMTSSNSHKGVRIHWDDIMLERSYNPLLAYKQSKLCNLLFTKELNNRYGSLGLRAYAVDPGLVQTDIGNKQTGSMVSLIWSIRKRFGVAPSIPAQTYRYLCTQQEYPSGFYYYGCKEQSYSHQVTDDNARRLFALSERLCAITYGDVS